MKEKTLQLKTAFRAVMLILMLCGVGITKGFAYDFSATYGGKTLYYNITDAENHYVELTYPGTSGYNSWDGYTKPTGNLSLPSNVSYNNTTYSVNRIGWYAFSRCTGLTSINLSSSITSIGGSAFFGCNGLTGTLVIGNNVSTIYGQAFLGCSNITAVVLGENVTIVSTRAFDGCTNLTEITIGEGVTQIYDGAFGDCPLLTTVHFNATNCTRMYSGDPEEEWDDVYSVFSTFNGETPAISTLTIGENVQNIPDFAFKDCLNLTTVTIPNSVTTIGGCAFYNCAGLTSFTLGTSLNTIYSWAFRNCSNVSSISIFDTTPAGVYSDAFSGIGTGIPVYVPCGTTQIYSNGSSLQWYWRRFTNYQEQNWNNLVVSSNDNYKGTAEITQEATCSDNAIVTAIPNAGVFQNWTEGGEVVSTDNPYSFELTSDRNLVANFVPVEIIEGDYKYTVDLVTGEASVKANNTSVTTSSFATSITYQSTDYPVTSIAKNGFKDCINITEMIIPNSIITIESGAFSRCRFTKVVIPSSVTSIGQQAFFNCISLNEVIFEDGPTLITLYNNKYSDGIGGGLFENCPVEIAYIGRNISVSNYNDSYNRPWTNAPFSRWNANSYAPLTEVIIGSGVTQLCNYFFEKCNAISSIISYIENPASMSMGANVFRQVPQTTCFLYVAENSIEEYHNTNQWNSFTNIHTMQYDIIQFADSNVKDICVNRWDTNGDGELNYTEAEAVTNLFGVFYDDTTIVSFNELQYFTRLTKLDNNSMGYFSGCSQLKSIVIPVSVTNIYESVFYDCSSLEHIMVVSGNSVYDSRDNCNAVIQTNSNMLVVGCKNTTIPNTVTSIGRYAFQGCTGITSLTIPNSIISIDYSAFYNCDNLTSVELPNSLTSINSGAFRGCGHLEHIIMESGNSVYDSRDNCNAVIKTSINELILGCKTTIIPNSVTSIGSSSFYECTGLTSLTIPNSVTNIGNEAFYRCTGLTSVTIGENVETITSYAFAYCNGLTMMVVKATTPPTITNTVFTGVTKSIPIYVPNGSISVYQNASGWNQFTNYQEIEMANVSITGYGESTDSDHWVFIASPLITNVLPSAIDELIANTGENYDLYRFNQSGEHGEWENYKSHTSGFVLENGKGYLYANKNDVTLTFAGAMNLTVSQEVELDFDGSANLSGWNLVGNPFNEAAYIDRPYYMMNGAGSDVTPVVTYGTTPVAAYSGVVVHAETSGESVTFTKVSSKSSYNGSLQITLAKAGVRGNEMQDMAVISFDENEQLGKFIFNEDHAKLYIPQNGDDYAIAYSNGQEEIPLYFRTKETGVYTINFENNAELKDAYLIDKFEGVVVNLNDDKSHTFIGSAADRPDRFVIRFKDYNDSESSIFAYQNGNEIIVNGEGDLQVFDVMGRVVAERHINGVESVAKPSQNGVYIIRLNEKNQKIVVR